MFEEETANHTLKEDTQDKPVDLMSILEVNLIPVQSDDTRHGGSQQCRWPHRDGVAKSRPQLTGLSQWQ